MQFNVTVPGLRWWLADNVVGSGFIVYLIGGVLDPGMLSLPVLAAHVWCVSRRTCRAGTCCVTCAGFLSTCGCVTLG